MVSSRTVLNAIVGAVASVVLSALPLSTLLGGVISGFLEGPDGQNGALAGALAGLLAFLPFLGIAVLASAVLGLGATVGTVPGEGLAFVLLIVGFLAAVIFVYTVVLALVGGYLGAYLAREYPDRHASVRDAIGDYRPDRPDRHETN